MKESLAQALSGERVRGKKIEIAEESATLPRAFSRERNVWDARHEGPQSDAVTGAARLQSVNLNEHAGDSSTPNACVQWIMPSPSLDLA